jgi:hypothetical protein
VIEYNVCRSVQKCVIIMVMESVREKCNKVGIRALVRGSKHDIYSGVKLHPTPHDSKTLHAPPRKRSASKGFRGVSQCLTMLPFFGIIVV